MDALLRHVVLNVNISSREIFLLPHASSVIIPVLWVFSGDDLMAMLIQLFLFVSDQTNDAVFVAFGMEMVKLTNIQAAEAAHILGGDHSADDVMHGENPVESKVSDGDNKTDVELPYGVSGELGETTNANHQPSSSVVPGGGRLASTKPVDGPNENGKKKPRLA
ncbi:hypothetical protein Bca4012_051702 [Brassica carinata]